MKENEEETDEENEEDKNIKNNFAAINDNRENGNEEILLDEKLYQIINNRDILYNKNLKYLSKDNYNIIIQIINKLDNISILNFVFYLIKIDIPIIKVLFKGFIEFEFNDEKTKNILEILSKIIGIYFNKNLFNFIYKKLSKQFRVHDKIKNLK